MAQVDIVGLGNPEAGVQGHAVEHVVEHGGERPGVDAGHVGVLVAVADLPEGGGDVGGLRQPHLGAVDAQYAEPPEAEMVAVRIADIHDRLLVEFDERRVLQAVAGLTVGAGGDTGLVQPVKPFVDHQLDRLDALAQHEQHHQRKGQGARPGEIRRLLAVAGFEACIVDQRLADGQAWFFNMGIAMIKALLCTLFRLAASPEDNGFIWLLHCAI